MKGLIAMIFLAVLLGPVSAEKVPAGAVTLIPVLGVGFGKVIEIRGRIVDDTDTRVRAHLGKRLVRVSVIDGKELGQPILIELEAPSFGGVELPERGAEVRMRGYETGGFVGVPDKAFEDLPRTATTGHHFESRFMVTALLSKTDAGAAPNP